MVCDLSALPVRWTRLSDIGSILGVVLYAVFPFSTSEIVGAFIVEEEC